MIARIKYLILLMLLPYMIASCNSANKKTTSDSYQFNWKVAGVIPDSQEGKPSPGLAGPVVGVSNNRLIVGGGSNFPDGFPWDGGKKKYYDEVYVYQKNGDTLVTGEKVFHLPFCVAYSANCSTDKGVVVAGGQNEEGILDKALLLNWDTGQNQLDIQELPSLPQPLTAARAAALGNHVYLAGGQNEEGVSNQLYHLDLNHPDEGWDTLAQIPERVTHCVLYSVTNNTSSYLYLVGGRKSNTDSTSTLYSKVYKYDMKANRWLQKTSLPFALSAQTGVTWNDSTLLVFSGDRGKTFHATEVLIMQIAREKDPTKKKLLIKEKNELQKNHPGFSGDVLLYNMHINEWEQTDSIPFPGQVTTTAVRWGNEVVIPCGEIRAGVRTPDIVLGSVE